MAPVILGIDFLQKNELILDFTQTPVVVRSSSQKRDALTENSMAIAQVVPIYEAAKSMLPKFVPFQLTKNQRLM